MTLTTLLRDSVQEAKSSGLSGLPPSVLAPSQVPKGGRVAQTFLILIHSLPPQINSPYCRLHSPPPPKGISNRTISLDSHIPAHLPPLPYLSLVQANVNKQLSECFSSSSLLVRIYGCFSHSLSQTARRSRYRCLSVTTSTLVCRSPTSRFSHHPNRNTNTRI